MLVHVVPSILRRSSLTALLLPFSGANSLFFDAWNTLISLSWHLNASGELPEVATVAFSSYALLGLENRHTSVQWRCPYALLVYRPIESQDTRKTWICVRIVSLYFYIL